MTVEEHRTHIAKALKPLLVALNAAYHDGITVKWEIGHDPGGVDMRCKELILSLRTSYPLEK